jgi:hypothetical protein
LDIDTPNRHAAAEHEPDEGLPLRTRFWSTDSSTTPVATPNQGGDEQQEHRGVADDVGERRPATSIAPPTRPVAGR